MKGAALQSAYIPGWKPFPDVHTKSPPRFVYIRLQMRSKCSPDKRKEVASRDTQQTLKNPQRIHRNRVGYATHLRPLRQPLKFSAGLHSLLRLIRADEN